MTSLHVICLGTRQRKTHFPEAFRSLKWKLVRVNNISRMVKVFIDGMFLGNILLEIKLANHLKGWFHGSAHVHKSKYFFSDFLLKYYQLKAAFTYTSVINHIL